MINWAKYIDGLKIKNYLSNSIRYFPSYLLENIPYKAKACIVAFTIT
jgi:hypothetical protein